jgi:nicotinamidase/pyrazinamidase
MTKALLIVDMQKDFMPDGALGVAGAEEIVPIINALIPRFSLVVASQDWHPPDHVSFAENHPGKNVGDVIRVKDTQQVLWPVHCVRATKGAEIIHELKKNGIASYFYKGTDKHIDGYSAFFDNARLKSTGLGDYLRSRGVVSIYIAGVATDYCVLYSTIDAIDLGFSVFVIKDACRAINLHAGDEDRAFAAMASKGATIVASFDLECG